MSLISRLMIISLAGLKLLLAAPYSSAGMIDKEGMAPWEICAMCHNLDGISVMDKFPKLAGQKAPYIEKQMHDFHVGNRDNDGGQMKSMMTEVAPNEISIIAKYFSSLPPPRAGSHEQGDHSNLGKNLFQRGKEGLPACISCHNASHPLAPWLQAQHGAYLYKQLLNFQSGERSNDRSRVMRDVAKQLTENDVNALVKYLKTSNRSITAPH
jgi:cytochrome c553